MDPVSSDPLMQAVDTCHKLVEDLRQHCHMSSSLYNFVVQVQALAGGLRSVSDQGRQHDGFTAIARSSREKLVELSK